MQVKLVTKYFLKKMRKQIFIAIFKFCKILVKVGTTEYPDYLQIISNIKNLKKKSRK